MAGIEIIGIAASVVQIADAGARLSSKLFIFTRKVKNADRTISEISQEIAATGAALRELGEALEQDKYAKLGSRHSIDITSQIVADCWKVFSDINETIGGDKIIKEGSENDEKASSSTLLSGFGKPSFSLKQRLKFPYIEPQIMLLKSKLESLKGSLMLMLQVLMLAEQVRNRPQVAVTEDQKALIETLIEERNDKEKQFRTSCMAIEDTSDSTSLYDVEETARTLVAAPSAAGSTSNLYLLPDEVASEGRRPDECHTPRALCMAAITVPNYTGETALNLPLRQDSENMEADYASTQSLTSTPKLTPTSTMETSSEFVEGLSCGSDTHTYISGGLPTQVMDGNPRMLTSGGRRTFTYATPSQNMTPTMSAAATKDLPAILRIRQEEIQHHAQLVENLLEEISNVQYRIDHGIRHRMHDGVLKIHWEEWTPYAKRYGHDHFLDAFELSNHRHLSRYWLDHQEYSLETPTLHPSSVSPEPFKADQSYPILDPLLASEKKYIDIGQMISRDRQYETRRPSQFGPFPSGDSYVSHLADVGTPARRCPHPDCGRIFRDLKAHMLTHSAERPEKCVTPSREYDLAGFARKYDKNRHTLVRFKGIMVCGFCPGSGSEKSFNRADVFQRHLISVHSVERTPSNSRKRSPASATKKLSSYCQDATGKCSICSATFSDAQDFYEHLEDCVVRAVEEEESGAASVNSESLSNAGEGDSIITASARPQEAPMTVADAGNIPVNEREAKPEGPFVGLEGLVVTKEGYVQDNEANLVGRVVEGDLKKLVGKAVDEDGDIVDKFGNVIGHAKPEVESPFVGLQNIVVTRDGSVRDSEDNVVGMIVNAQVEVEQLVGRTVLDNGNVLDENGNVVGHAEALMNIMEDGDEAQEVVADRHDNNPEAPFAGIENTVVKAEGWVEDGLGNVVGKVVESHMSIKRLVGRVVDEDGDVLDKHGNVLGHAERYEQPEKEIVTEDALLTMLAGKIVNSDGNLVNKQGEIFGHVVEGNLKQLIGRKADAEGNIWGKKGKIIGRAGLPADVIAGLPKRDCEIEEKEREIQIEIAEDDIVPEGAAGDPSSFAGRKEWALSALDTDEGAEDTAEEVTEGAKDTAVDLSVLKGLKVDLSGYLLDEGVVVGKVDQGEPVDLAGYEVVDNGEILDGDGDIVGRAIVLPRQAQPQPRGYSERHQRSASPFTASCVRGSTTLLRSLRSKEVGSEDVAGGAADAGSRNRGPTSESTQATSIDTLATGLQGRARTTTNVARESHPPTPERSIILSSTHYGFDPGFGSRRLTRSEAEAPSTSVASTMNAEDEDLGQDKRPPGDVSGRVTDLQSALSMFTNLLDNEIILVCDAGGGTVDLEYFGGTPTT